MSHSHYVTNYDADLDLKVVGEQVDPLGDPSGQSLLDGLGINLDVANGGTCGQCLDLLLL